MLPSRKTIKQRRVAGAKIVQIKKTSRKKNNGLSNQHKYNNYITNKSHNSQSNDEANPDDMEKINIG